MREATGATSFDRRTLLRGGAGAAVTMMGGVALTAAHMHPHRPFGCAVQASQIYGNAAFAAAVAADCAIVTPEIALNWNKIEASEGDLDFYEADRIEDFCRSHGQTMGGHVLLWHLSIPAWAEPGLMQRNGWDLIKRYMSSVVPRYGTITDHWEVVNEPLLMGYRDDGLRPSPFLTAFGPDYIGRAFHEARRYAPAAKLSLNEFGLEYTFNEERNKRYHLLRLVERLKKAGVPIHGVGLQSHLDLAKQSQFDPNVVSQFVKELADMGLEIRITELDVKEYDYMASAEQRDRNVADAVDRYLDAILTCPAVTQVSCWGLSDRYSWLEVSKADLARGNWPLGVGPGLNRGLPLDSDMHPKPFWHTLQSKLKL